MKRRVLVGTIASLSVLLGFGVGSASNDPVRQCDEDAAYVEWITELGPTSRCIPLDNLTWTP